MMPPIGDPDRWAIVQALFNAALDKSQPEQGRFLEEQAGDDKDLLAQVVRMLESDARASFLDTPIAPSADELLQGVDIVPQSTVGPYKLLHKLGGGGMGSVYLAQRDDWQSKVAIKIPRDLWISSDQMKRFAEEQRVLAHLIHPFIARIYESGTLANGTPWFAMEYVDGQTLTEYCSGKKASLRHRLELIGDVCEAVQYAHSQAIIHRDLKPSNIFVTASGQVKLLDFGIAKQLSASLGVATLTRVGQQPVTLAYGAPEQVLANVLSTQTDVYSLGVILFELLTGALPFDLAELTPGQAEELIRTKEPKKPSVVAAGGAKVQTSLGELPRASPSEWADLNVLTLTAMHKDVSKRYRSIDAFRRDIHHFLKSEPLEARADSIPYRLGKFAKRRRLPLLLSAATLALIVTLVASYTHQLKKARDAAVAEVARTRLARQFTQDLLEGGDQEVGPSKDLRVIDLLDRGFAKAKNLNQDPIQQGELYTTLGSLFLNLGEFQKAGSALHSAYRILSTHAPDSHEFAEVLIDLGLLDAAQSHSEGAESWARKGLALEQRQIPPDPGTIFKYKLVLAHAIIYQKPQAAIELLVPLSNDLARAPDDDTRATVLNLLSTAYINVGDYAHAEAPARGAVVYTRKSKPPNHPDIAPVLIDLAYIQRNGKRLADADRALREALAIDEAWYPKDHPELADVRRLLADLLLEEGRLDEAEGLAGRALAGLKTAYGENNEKVAYAIQLLGRLALAKGRLREAEERFRKEISIFRTVGNASNLPFALTYLGDVLMQKKSFPQAEAAYRESIASFPLSPSEHSAGQARANRKLGEALIAQHRYAEAEPPLLAGYSVWSTRPNDGGQEIVAARADLAQVYKATNQPGKLGNVTGPLTRAGQPGPGAQPPTQPPALSAQPQ